MADEIRIRLSADISSFKSDMSDAAASVEDSVARFNAAQATFAAMAAQSAEAAELMHAAFDEATAAGASSTEALEAGAQAYAEFSASVTEAADAQLEAAAGSDLLAAAYRQMAAATLEAVEARATLNATIAENVGQDSVDAIAAVAAAQVRASASAEQLALAKANLAEAQEYVATTANQEALADEEVTVAAETQFAALEETTAATTAMGISSRQAATAGMGILEGRLQSGTRAASAFLTTTLGLGPILQAAFPVIGAIALIDVVAQVIEKFESLKKAGNEAAANIQESFERADDRIRGSNDTLLTETDHLQNQIDKLLGHPSENGAKTAFDEMTASANELSNAIDRDLQEMDKLVSETNKKNTVGFWESLYSGKAETGDIQAKVKRANDSIASVHEEYKPVIEDAEQSGNKENLDSAQQDRLAALQKAYQQAESTIGPILQDLRKKQADFIETGFGSDQTAKINTAASALKMWHDEQVNIGEEYLKGHLQQALTPLQENKGADNKADQAKLRGFEDTFNQLRAAHQLTTEDEIAFWEAMIAQSKKGSESYHTITSKLGELWAKEANEIASSQNKLEKSTEAFAELSAKAVSPDEQSILPRGGDNGQDYVKSIEDAAKANAQWADELERAQEIEARNAQALAEETLRAQEASGAIHGLAALHAEATLHAKEQTEELKRLEDQLRRVQDASYLTPEQKRAQEQGTQNKISEVQGQGQIVNAQDAAKQLAEVQQQYEKFINTVDHDFIRAFDSWIQHQQTFAQAFTRSLGEMEVSLANSALKMTLKWAQHEAMMTAAHLAGIATRKGQDALSDSQLVTELAQKLAKWVANELGITTAHTAANATRLTSDTTTAATSQAVAATTNAALITSDAAVAAAGAYAATAVIPVVGPALAPAAAASALAAVESFASMAAFEAGGIVAGASGMPVPIMAHAGERVLSAPQTQQFERMVNQSGSSGGSTNHLHYSPTINGLDKAGTEKILDQHKDHLFRMMRQGWNSGALK